MKQNTPGFKITGRSGDMIVNKLAKLKFRTHIASGSTASMDMEQKLVSHLTADELENVLHMIEYLIVAAMAGAAYVMIMAAS